MKVAFLFLFVFFTPGTHPFAQVKKIDTTLKLRNINTILEPLKNASISGIIHFSHGKITDTRYKTLDKYIIGCEFVLCLYEVNAIAADGMIVLGKKLGTSNLPNTFKNKDYHNYYQFDVVLPTDKKAVLVFCYNNKPADQNDYNNLTNELNLYESREAAISLAKEPLTVYPKYDKQYQYLQFYIIEPWLFTDNKGKLKAHLNISISI